MRIASNEIIQNFKPIRVEIDAQTGQEMDDIATILKYARTYMKAFKGPNTDRQSAIIDALLPHFERV